MHIHQVGQCIPFAAAGGHWNPSYRHHGHDNPQGPHLGDLPNLIVATDTAVDIAVDAAGARLQGNVLFDFDGASILIHEAPDDGRSNPNGNAGRPIACGVIERR
jgi:superoxide dismutase, Cu-Zn family